MGYKEGEGIGKSVKGRIAPIEVDLKSGRTGLGVDEARKRQKVAANLLRQEKGNFIDGVQGDCTHGRFQVELLMVTSLSPCRSKAKKSLGGPAL